MEVQPEDPRKPQKDAPKDPEKNKPQVAPAREGEMEEEPDYGETSYRGCARLEGRVALITGGDSGIGRAVALAYAREGADVAIVYHTSHDDAQKTGKLVEAAGQNSLLIAVDLATKEGCDAAVKEVVRAFSRIDILVNNAAYQGESVERFEDLTEERVDRTFRTNVIAMFHLVRAALPYMEEGACVINVSSVQAYSPRPEILDYATTKGAIVTFTKGLAQSLIKRGIRVNAVAPGPVWTPLVVQSFDEQQLAKFGKNNPMGRAAQPVEIAPAFVFLASHEARFVNGEVLGVHGGKHVGT